MPRRGGAFFQYDDSGDVAAVDDAGGSRRLPSSHDRRSARARRGSVVESADPRPAEELSEPSLDDMLAAMDEPELPSAPPLPVEAPEPELPFTESLPAGPTAAEPVEAEPVAAEPVE